MRLKRLMGIVLVFTCIASATGCAIGFGARTNSQKPSGNGRYLTVGDLEIRGATIVADPKDPSKGVLLATIYNSGQTDDEFVTVNEPPASLDPKDIEQYGPLDPDATRISGGKALVIRPGRNPQFSVPLISPKGLLKPGNFVAVNFNFKQTPDADLKLLVNANDGIYSDVKVQ